MLKRLSRGFFVFVAFAGALLLTHFQAKPTSHRNHQPNEWSTNESAVNTGKHNQYALSSVLDVPQGSSFSSF
jgi:hypothetical protein